MLSRIRFALARFRHSEKGTLSVEAVMVFPMLLWAYAAMFIYWDAFKAQNINLKATYTVADLISREVLPITDTYIDGMNEVYEFLIRREDGNNLRVTTVSMAIDPASDPADPDVEHRLCWSRATGDMAPIDDIGLLTNRLPIMAPGDTLIVVETEMTWTPPFNFVLWDTGLSEAEYTNLVFTSPRFAATVHVDSDLDGNPDGCD
ncbi:MAG: hypothetical protein AAFR35_11380 [Pseudomonadota bacterium]